MMVKRVSTDLVLGAHVPPEGFTFAEMKEICLTAERVGFDLFTTTDHLMRMAQPDTIEGRYPLECWSTLAGLAAATRRIRLAPLVSCYGYRRPTVLAKMATTVDIISNGRLIFGIGAGWHQQEFEGFMGRFPPVGERMNGLEETIQICRSMFTNQRTSFQGNLYQVENVVNSPLPVQRPMPLLVGGGGLKRTLKIAATYADISHFDVCPSGDVLNQKLTALMSHCKTVGRDYGDIQKGVAFYLVLGDTEEDVEKRIREGAHWRYSPVDRFRSRVGPVKWDIDQCVTAMRGYMEKGVSFFTVYFVSYAYQRVLEDLTVFAEEIMPQIR